MHSARLCEHSKNRLENWRWRYIRFQILSGSKKKIKGLAENVEDNLEKGSWVLLDLWGPVTDKSPQAVLHFQIRISEKQDPDPDLHRSEKVEALESHFGVMKGPNLIKSEL
jgi:hypothetical protein